MVFGLAGSLTMGTLQVRGGLDAVFDTGATNTVSFTIMGVLFACYMLSATTGCRQGHQDPVEPETC